ncbi:hypothetical protein LTR84_002114 [Exophiala bonariae]|uniref:Protein kinase domain-containing protein n=1 Tax=Exophiala bonariae TaxID=1690606 RepID=A0AAV9NE02_9EURO|nr:hypothetical protein LTR84_002114 [Exophiala bonariae]
MAMASTSSEMVGASGRCYVFHQLIQEREHLGRLWLATSGHDKFILKDIPENIFSAFNEDIGPSLPKTSYLRLPLDTIAEQRIFVYKYLTDDFLSLVSKQIPVRTAKHILKSTLRGIAELHDQDIVHLDIKPDNIMVDCCYVDQVLTIEEVQIIDFENACYLPKSRNIKGMLAGNDNWRSPAAHVRGALNKPTDIFSFGVVYIFAMFGRVIVGRDDDFQKHEELDALPAMIRL